MKFVCVYKSGGAFDERYVRALYMGIKRYANMTSNSEFYCLTDKPKEVDQYAIPIPLKYDFPNWWCKMELFNPENFNDDEPILYFDLDVLLLKPINELVDLCHNHLVMPRMLRSADPIGWNNDWPSSSIMSWKGKQLHRIWYEWMKRGPEKVMKDMLTNTSRAGQRTDQGFIRKIVNPLKFQDPLPNGYVKFKVDYLNEEHNNFINTATILNWTGNPRFHKMGQGIFKEVYKIWQSRLFEFSKEQIISMT